MEACPFTHRKLQLSYSSSSITALLLILTWIYIFTNNTEAALSLLNVVQDFISALQLQKPQQHAHLIAAFKAVSSTRRYSIHWAPNKTSLRETIKHFHEGHPLTPPWIVKEPASLCRSQWTRHRVNLQQPPGGSYQLLLNQRHAPTAARCDQVLFLQASRFFRLSSPLTKDFTYLPLLILCTSLLAVQLQSHRHTVTVQRQHLVLSETFTAFLLGHLRAMRGSQHQHSAFACRAGVPAARFPSQRCPLPALLPPSRARRTLRAVPRGPLRKETIVALRFCTLRNKLLPVVTAPRWTGKCFTFICTEDGSWPPPVSCNKQQSRRDAFSYTAPCEGVMSWLLT